MYNPSENDILNKAPYPPYTHGSTFPSSRDPNQPPYQPSFQPPNQPPNQPPCQPPYKGEGYPAAGNEDLLPYSDDAPPVVPSAPMEPPPGYTNVGFDGGNVSLPPKYEDIDKYFPKQRPEIKGASVITEEEARNALLTLCKSHCCWGSKAAREMNILNMKTTNAFHYCLETFCEKRTTMWASIPYAGQMLDGPQNGYPPMPWDVPVSFPEMFKSGSKSVEVPHTACMKGCDRCQAKGYMRCNWCSGYGQSRCTFCNGSGHRSSSHTGHHIDHHMDHHMGHNMGPNMGHNMDHHMGHNMGHNVDHHMGHNMNHHMDCHIGHNMGHNMGPHTGHHMHGSSPHMTIQCGPERCFTCSGTGWKRCHSCSGSGRIKCQTCLGSSFMKWFIQLTVQWTNQVEHHVSDESGMPNELVKGVSGDIGFKEENVRVFPITHCPEPKINKASADLIAKHAIAFPNERILFQRQTVKLVPVTETQAQWKNTEFRFFVYGLEKKVYTENYPQTKCCGCSIL